MQCPECGCWTVVPRPTGHSARTTHASPLPEKPSRPARPQRSHPVPPPLPPRSQAEKKPPAGSPAGEESQATADESLSAGMPRIAPPSLPRVETRDRLEPPQRPTPRPTPTIGAYCADRGKRQTVRLLALMLAAIALVGLTPVVWFGQLPMAPAPAWAVLVTFVAVLQLLYVAWLVVTPDWATLRVLAGGFLLVAIAYGLGWLLLVTAPPADILSLGLADHRRSAPRWCASVLLLNLLASYLCGQTAARWRRTVLRNAATHTTHMPHLPR